MRRRDADDPADFHGATDTGRAVLVCLALSVALHALLVVAAGTLRAARPHPPASIQVSLVRGDGSESSEGGAQETVAAPMPASAAPLVDARQRPVDSARARTLARTRPHSARSPQPAVLVAVDRAAGEELAVSAEAVGLGNAHDRSGYGMTGAAGGGGTQTGGAGIGESLDARTFCLSCPEPAYPLIARARGWQGTVEVALSVRADGSVNGASLGRSSGHRALDDAALAVARLSRFHPPNDGNLSTPLRGRIEYRFVLR
ncbi:MAG: energy transducer TonB [Candidatus Binatia bacterium]